MSLQLRGLSHRFGKKAALQDVDLHLAVGDIYGFLGHNGAGKTTALRIALGLLAPHRGQVLIDGHDLARNPRARALVGGLIERPGFFDHFSGRKNLQMLARLQPGREALQNVDPTLDLVGLTEAAGKPVGQYSQGMRQRLGLAQALLEKPRYLLLDEPTNGLDPEGIHDLRGILLRLAHDTGVTILLSSHLLSEVADLCNRVGVLHQGRLLVEAPTAELLGSGPDRFHLETDDDDEVLAHLAPRADLQVSPDPSGGLTVSVLEGDPSHLVSELATAGRQIRAWTPDRPTLEQIYLDYTQGKRQGSGPATAAPTPTPPADLPRQRRVLSRIQRYEATRLRRVLPTLAILAPAALAPIVIFHRNLSLQKDAAELAGETLASASGVTAFEALGRALQTSLPLLTLVIAALASQSISSELSSGTLRNLLMRPFRRVEVAIGKLATLTVVAMIGYALLLASAAIAAGSWFDYGDLVEHLATGTTFPLLPAADVWPELWPALASPLVPLVAWTTIGFLCGTIARSAAGGLGLLGGAWVVLELLRGFLRTFGAEGWLPGPYLPSPLANNSHVDYFVSFASGASNATNEFGGAVLVVPGGWAVLSGMLAVVCLGRRYVG